MNKNLQTAPPTTTGAESAEEIIGVLTAISVVSKRLARRLTLLEQQSIGKDGEPHERNKHPASAD